MPTWFAGVLRDGFALTAAGAYADFASVARDGVWAVLSGLEGWTGTRKPQPSTSWTASLTWTCTPMCRTA